MSTQLHFNNANYFKTVYQPIIVPHLQYIHTLHDWDFVFGNNLMLNIFRGQY